MTLGRDRCTLSRTLDHGAVLLAVAPRLTRLTLNDFEGISPSAVSKLVQLLQHLRHLKHLSLDGPPEVCNALVFTVRLASTLTCQDCPSQNLPKDTQPHCRSLQCKGIVSFEKLRWTCIRCSVIGLPRYRRSNIISVCAGLEGQPRTFRI